MIKENKNVGRGQKNFRKKQTRNGLMKEKAKDGCKSRILSLAAIEQWYFKKANLGEKRITRIKLLDLQAQGNIPFQV